MRISLFSIFSRPLYTLPHGPREEIVACAKSFRNALEKVDNNLSLHNAKSNRENYKLIKSELSHLIKSAEKGKIESTGMHLNSITRFSEKFYALATNGNGPIRLGDARLLHQDLIEKFRTECKNVADIDPSTFKKPRPYTICELPKSGHAPGSLTPGREFNLHPAASAPWRPSVASPHPQYAMDVHSARYLDVPHTLRFSHRVEFNVPAYPAPTGPRDV